MAQTKRGSRRKLKAGNIVYAKQEMVCRTPAGPVFNGVPPEGKYSHRIAEGTCGICRCEVPDEPGLWIVDFEDDDNKTVGMEVEAANVAVSSAA